METFIVPSGLYAVFNHKGDFNEFAKTFKYILEIWLPNSDYILDNRPHFEVLGDKYKNNRQDSEEEIWISIIAKQQILTNKSPPLIILLKKYKMK